MNLAKMSDEGLQSALDQTLADQAVMSAERGKAQDEYRAGGHKLQAQADQIASEIRIRRVLADVEPADRAAVAARLRED